MEKKEPYETNLNEECTCNGDVVRLVWSSGRKGPHCRMFSLYKTLIIDNQRVPQGWIYFILENNDKFPIIITEEAAKEIMENPEIGDTLAFNRYLDRYR